MRKPPEEEVSRSAAGQQHSSSSSSPEATAAAPAEAAALSVAELAKTVAVQPQVREPLPGLFASMGLETVYFIRCGERAAIVDTGYVHTFGAHLNNFEA